MTTNETTEFGAAYQRWAEAEALVSEFEHEIFAEGHTLTARELACLRVMRATAAMRLSELISDIDTEFGRLHALGGPPDIHPAGDGFYLAVRPGPSS